MHMCIVLLLPNIVKLQSMIFERKNRKGNKIFRKKNVKDPNNPRFKQELINMLNEKYLNFIDFLPSCIKSSIIDDSGEYCKFKQPGEYEDAYFDLKDIYQLNQNIDEPKNPKSLAIDDLEDVCCQKILYNSFPCNSVN